MSTIILDYLLHENNENSSPIDISLTKGQKTTIITIRLVLSFLSLFGSIFVIYLMMKFKQFNGPQRLIFLLTICNLGEAITNLLSMLIFSHEVEYSSSFFINIGISLTLYYFHY